MTKTTFFKSLLLTIAIGFSSLSVYAQASLPFSYNLGNPTGVAGLTATGLGSNYPASPLMKFDDTNDNLVLNFNSIPGNLSFVIKWNQSTTATRFPGNFSLLESINGTDYTLVQLFNSTTGPELKNGVNVTVTVTNLKPESRFLKWEYTAKTNGNIALGAINLVAQSSSTCTASTLSFADATINKTMGDAAFTIAATSLNTTTAISYESDNTAVATVNAATGEVTLVAAGTAKIKATQAAGAHASVDYCAATAEYTLNVPTNVPTITVTEVLPAFAAGIGANDQKTLTVTAANLTTDIALTITGADAAMFTVTNTLPAAGGSATITYSPTAPGAHTATLALNSTGATEVLITLNGTGLSLNGTGTKINPYSVAEVKALNNSLGTATKYWVEGYIVGTPSAGDGTNLTNVALVAPFSNTALALADVASETDLTKMIGVQLPTGAVRTGLNLVDNAGNLNRKVKVFGTLEGYFSGTPGVRNTTEFEISSTNSAPSATIQSLRKVGNQIVFETSAQQSVEIFNVTGQRLMSTTSIDGVNAITVNTKGLVLVKIGKETAKVIM